MNWAQVFKINNNMKRTLNEQIRDLKYTPIRIITKNETYTPEKTGLYKIICVGAGGSGSYTSASENYETGARASSGGGGGVAIITQRLFSGQSYNVTVSTTASFGNIASATAGASDSSSGESGTASGGDYNFAGLKGEGFYGKSGTPRTAGGVGVYLSELSRVVMIAKYYSEAMPHVSLTYGQSILGFGGGGPAAVYEKSSRYFGDSLPGQPAAVIIIPLEMED